VSKHAEGLKALQADFVCVIDHYCEKFNIKRDDIWALGKLSEELGELSQAYLRLHGRARVPENKVDLRLAFEDEVADLLGLILIFADMQQVDVAAAAERKWFKYLPESDVGKV
jgi:NTP pyrophosphatase (non-canonical NTP hydrolase)